MRILRIPMGIGLPRQIEVLQPVLPQQVIPTVLPLTWLAAVFPRRHDRRSGGIDGFQPLGELRVVWQRPEPQRRVPVISSPFEERIVPGLIDLIGVYGFREREWRVACVVRSEVKCPRSEAQVPR